MEAIAGRFSIVRVSPERLLVPVTIFLGALLLFAVEPMIAKMILPWFGGAADVWIVCLLFFQTALLGGYVYAHLLTTRVAPARQWRVHLFLLAASLIFLPVTPSERWKPVGSEEPLFLILALLTASIGLPFLLLSATGPLLQAWLAQSRDRGVPGPQSIYRLYALSNFASLLALLSYPVLIEPALTTRFQAWSWSLLYCLFVLLAAATAWGCRNLTPNARVASREAGASVSFAQSALWFLLALAPSALLLAMTHHMLRNIAAMPLLWVVPLALYLLSLIVAFDHPRWYYRPVWYVLFAAACAAMIYFVAGDFFTDSFGLRLAFFSAGLFICCMVCHGELAALKPEPVHLTRFYLIVAAGGAAGGLLVAAVAPFVFNDDYDLPLLLPIIALLVMVVAWRRIPAGVPNWLRWNGLICAAYLLVFVTGEMLIALRADFEGNVVSLRNFYGPLRVTIVPADRYTRELIQLRNGNIIHGREYTAPERYCEPISYYAPPSGIGATLRELGEQGPLKIGIVGLGAGMIAGYGRQAICSVSTRSIHSCSSLRRMYFTICPVLDSRAWLSAMRGWP
jgi:hypothetical protein